MYPMASHQIRRLSGSKLQSTDRPFPAAADALEAEDSFGAEGMLVDVAVVVEATRVEVNTKSVESSRGESIRIDVSTEASTV